MICRKYNEGPRLDVAGLNEIVVIVDRSETARTEVGLNIWPAGTIGPPHEHPEKEQTFFVMSGRGRITVGDETRAVEPGDVIFVPAGASHQTVVDAGADLEYLLYNAFLTDQREGHATFAEHIDKVKAVRRAQADGAAPPKGKP